MNNFTEVCKLSHFPLSANRLHQVNMKTHLPRTWGLQIVSLSFVGKPLAPSGHENTLASHLRSANCLTFLCRQTACTKWTWEHTCLALEVCKLSHFPLSANRLHQVDMRTHLPRTWGLQIVSLSFVGKPLAPSEHENTLASYFAHLIYCPLIKLKCN